MAGRSIDEVGPIEMFSIMKKEFGTQRTMELATWVILFGAMYREGDKQADTIKKVMALGFAQAGVYRAARDIRKLQALLGLGVPEMVEKIKSVELIEVEKITV